jgi:hypothetical protein
MVCFRYISVNTLHKGDDDDDDNIAVCLKEIGWVAWTGLIWLRIEALVDTVMYLPVP